MSRVGKSKYSGNSVVKKMLGEEEKDTSNIFDIKIQYHEKCGFCDDLKPVITVTEEIWKKWQYICGELPNDEWTGVLTIKDDKIIDFKIPKQEVKATECEILEELGGNGVVHWHHSIGAFHSSQDDKHCRNLYDWSIVLSTTGFVVSKKVKLPCGAFKHVDAKMTIEDSTIKTDIGNITIIKPVPIVKTTGRQPTLDSDYISGYFEKHGTYQGVRDLVPEVAISREQIQWAKDRLESYFGPMPRVVSGAAFADNMEYCYTCDTAGQDTCADCWVKYEVYGEYEEAMNNANTSDFTEEDELLGTLALSPGEELL